MYGRNIAAPVGGSGLPVVEAVCPFRSHRAMQTRQLDDSRRHSGMYGSIWPPSEHVRYVHLHLYHTHANPSAVQRCTETARTWRFRFEPGHVYIRQVENHPHVLSANALWSSSDRDSFIDSHLAACCSSNRTTIYSHHKF